MSETLHPDSSDDNLNFKKFPPNPERWVLRYTLNDSRTIVHKEVFFTMAAAMREIKILERRHLPVTIVDIRLTME